MILFCYKLIHTSGLSQTSKAIEKCQKTWKLLEFQPKRSISCRLHRELHRQELWVVHNTMQRIFAIPTDVPTSMYVAWFLPWAEEWAILVGAPNGGSTAWCYCSDLCVWWEEKKFCGWCVDDDTGGCTWMHVDLKQHYSEMLCIREIKASVEQIIWSSDVT